MSGQGSGGGGALVAIFGLWVIGVAIAFSQLGDSGNATESLVPSPTPDPNFGLDCSTDEACATPASRAELAGALDIALRPPEATDDAFDDDDGLDQEAAINRLAAAGLIGGCNDRAFCPESGATRAQLAAILVRAFDIEPGGDDAFDDDNGNPFEAEINAVAAAGFSGGCGERRFCPDSEVSRRALRDLLTRIAGLTAEPSATP
ncbi:MAG TPA: S-layer homology domain-containing protein [Candidatus Limnocylindria bacterium]|nr:S-layer homology domain-containing protein [Candidatus Limnocylindria bacterium]